MSIIAAAVKHLIAAGVTGDDLVRAIEDMEAAISPAQAVRTARQDRNRRYYEKRKASEKRLNKTVSDVSDVSDAPSSPEVPPHTPLPTPSNPIPPSPPKGGSSPTSTPRSELRVVLDEERAQAVLDHRQRIRKPLTAHAARLLAGKLGRCPSPNDAADAMIANGWQGFEPAWLENRTVANRANAPPPSGGVMMADFTGDLLRSMRNGHGTGTAGSTVEGGGAAGDHRSPAPAVRIPAGEGRR